MPWEDSRGRPGLCLVGPSLNLFIRDGFTPQQVLIHINNVYEILDALSDKQPPRATRVFYAITLTP